MKYYKTIPSPEARIFRLKTVAPDALVTNKISDQENSFKVTLDGNTVRISKADGSAIQVKPDGLGTFNRPKLLQDRKLFLSYKYENEDGTTSFAQDTLTFRNRIRDGSTGGMTKTRTIINRCQVTASSTSFRPYPLGKFLT